MIRVRFAPSPTGYLHIGGARTALFNFMYARSQGGQFILRIEDTDLQRSKPEYVDEIMDSMKWLGFSWDELYFQSKRFDIYRQYAQKLLDEGKAYKEETAVILKMPQQEVKLFDLIRGEIAFDSSMIKDQVLLKSDGSPTYSFCCVVDDSLMEISHVIRGEDHISNTPKQIIIYEALGLKPPKFAHLPLIMDEEGGRMSKRTGAVAVTDYRKEGFLPEAIVNYLMLLGWSPGNNQEMVEFATAIKNFSIKKVNKAAAAFSMDKLNWLNSQYIKKADSPKLVGLLKPLLLEKGYDLSLLSEEQLMNIVSLYKSRSSTLLEFVVWFEFLFKDDFAVEEEGRQKYLAGDLSAEFGRLAEDFQKVSNFETAAIEQTFRKTVEDLKLNPSDLVHPVRVALTGKVVGPGLFETIAALGKERTVARLTQAFRE